MTIALSICLIILTLWLVRLQWRINQLQKDHNRILVQLIRESDAHTQALISQHHYNRKIETVLGVMNDNIHRMYGRTPT